MDADKIFKVKPQDKPVSQPVVRPKPKTEPEVPLVELLPVLRPPQENDSVEQTGSNSEMTEYAEPLATTQSTGSMFSSGWEYSQLLKEFRD